MAAEMSLLNPAHTISCFNKRRNRQIYIIIRSFVRTNADSDKWFAKSFGAATPAHAGLLYSLNNILRNGFITDKNIDLIIRLGTGTGTGDTRRCYRMPYGNGIIG